ncbi:MULTISPECIES: chromosome segregation protein SMC [unclassified Haloferax]|uniref:chromosome segregation protein SMC n=1 Tax=unclassified Haloferax TaxID=2625095 RepID=UPI000E263D14|nr:MULTISPECIES: chromosome segregation protein SMC [unclassified Haloferax]RDZ37183.1 chromosome segregation protein SMC [Haloferax sp. Atlit-24N]RLM37980.1 chromosome segregation protein SMC [Haloferax sp. Atlit-109R]RLM45923.1 chromosome segregation protein SMC [Haloferax sp. Atlit-105R]
MHIKELVLDGFKSFGRPTRIPFYEDFTVVTGPNGSGKSNIIDGVLFALGLARTRGIRAEKLTDLIYNPGHADGSDEAPDKPKEASVTVVLDNSEGTLDRSQVVNAAGTDKVGGVEEITIKRRVKETPDNYYSYYYLNERSVNLSDIKDLLAQAGITPEGYNVVMQGDVTEIINMTPYQRRGIIDEIAGVAEFDEKKDAAFEELEAVEERVDEADLRIEEKETRLNQLADERETALTYKGLREEKEEYEGYLKAAELEDKREDLSRTESRIESTEADLEALQAELDERQGKVTRLEEDLEDLTREIERKGEDEQLRIKSEMEEIKGDISRLENAIEAAEEKRDDAEAERRKAFVDIDRKQEQIDDLEDDIREVKVEKASVKSDIQSKRVELSEVQAEIDSVDTEFDELKSELAERKETLDELKDEKNDRQRAKDRLLDDARRRSNQISETRDELERARERIPELKATVSDLHSELDTAEKNEAKIDGVIEDLQAEKADLNDELSEVTDELQTKQSEYARLEARAGKDGDNSWPRAVTTILNAGISGVHGAVGQLGSVDGEYAKACETAAGGRLANVVVDDDGVGSSCIDHLKSRNAGRATFLPITKMDNRSLPREPDNPGVVDFARNLVDYDSQYESIFSYVLGSTLVVEDMETARDLMGDYRMVTLDGDLVERSGAMTGGSGGGSRYSFSKSGEGKLDRLAKEITKLEDRRRSLNEEIRDIDDDLDDARGRASDAADRVRTIEREIEDAEEDIEEAEAEIDRLEDRLDELQSERESVDEQMSDLDDEIADLDDEIETVEAEIEDIEAELADSEIPELTARADEIRADIDDLEDRMSTLDGRLNEIQLEKQYAEDAVDDLHDTVEAAQNRKAEARESISEAESKIEEREDDLEAKREAVAELEEELVDLKEDRTELQDDLREARSARDEKKDRVNAVESKLESMRSAAERLEWEIDELQSQVGDYDPDEIPDHDTVESEIERLTEEMEELEPVNMLAIDEYDDVKADLEALQERRDVLVEERDAIADRIDQYESQKKATFMESFDAIAENFTDIFERLSNGTGHLQLENPDDPFEEGLTMKAQPGDKPIQRLDAMSGGEKSLTALAFIFAIQRHNPAPFYALDEVDAFLDAANAERVGQMVDDLAGDAQFVVVSHRSALLERAERAIGVTMQGDNVSAVTGIQFGGDGGAGSDGGDGRDADGSGGDDSGDSDGGDRPDDDADGGDGGEADADVEAEVPADD